MDERREERKGHGESEMTEEDVVGGMKDRGCENKRRYIRIRLEGKKLVMACADGRQEGLEGQTKVVLCMCQFNR